MATGLKERGAFFGGEWTGRMFITASLAGQVLNNQGPWLRFGFGGGRSLGVSRKLYRGHSQSMVESLGIVYNNRSSAH